MPRASVVVPPRLLHRRRRLCGRIFLYRTAVVCSGC